MYNETIKNEEKNEVEMKIIHEITLDVARHGIQASIPLTQHDAGMHSLLIHLRNGSREIKLSEDITATLYVSNDTYEDVIVYTENGAYPNTLECNITPYITKDTGEYTAQLQIYESGTKLFSAPEFTLIIKTDRSKDSQVLSSTPYAAVINARDAAAASAAQAAKIAEDLRKEIPVYKEYGDKTYSNALVGAALGTSVLMDDVSPLGHKIPVTLRSKNLIPYPYTYTSQTVNGVTFTDNGDGTITANGTASARTVFTLRWGTTVPIVSLHVGSSYVLSGCPAGGSSDSYLVQANITNEAGISNYVTDYGTGLAFTAKYDLIAAYIVIAEGYTANNLVFKPQLELGTTATKYTPYVPDGTEVTVRSCGKNLIRTNSFTVPYTDTTTLFDGKITGQFAFSFDDNLTGVDKSQAALFQFIVDGSSQYVTSYGWSQSMDKVFTFSGTLTKVYVHTWNGATGGSLDNIQLEVGTAKTEFEPYKQGETVTALANGTVELTSVSPNMTIWSDNANVITEATYNKDTNAVINNLFAEIANLKATITDLGGTT